MKPFDPTKPVQTRDGRPARILCTDRKSEQGYPIVALVSEGGGSESIRAYRDDGRYLSKESNLDLINFQQKIKMFVNVYSDGTGAVSQTRKAADMDAVYDRIACVELEVTEGQGL